MEGVRFEFHPRGRGGPGTPPAVYLISGPQGRDGPRAAQGLAQRIGNIPSLSIQSL